MHSSSAYCDLNQLSLVVAPLSQECLLRCNVSSVDHLRLKLLNDPARRCLAALQPYHSLFLHNSSCWTCYHYSYFLSSITLAMDCLSIRCLV